MAAVLEPQQLDGRLDERHPSLDRHLTIEAQLGRVGEVLVHCELLEYEVRLRHVAE